MTTFWSGFQSSASDADLTSPDTDVLLSMWNSQMMEMTRPDSNYVGPKMELMPADHTPATLQPILDVKPIVNANPIHVKQRKRTRDSSFPRTKVACTACYLSKSCCDQARPCSRCVRLNRPDECQDRVHKKRTTGVGARSAYARAASSSTLVDQKPISKAGVRPPPMDVNLSSACAISVEVMSGLFSTVLADLWLYQCQLMLSDAMTKGDDAFAYAVRRIEKGTVDLSGLVKGPVYISVRQRLYDLGIHVTSRTAPPIKRPPFHIITAAQAQEQDIDHENIAVIKSVQLPELLAGPNPRRGLYINDQAQRLFGYTADELCNMFNRTSADEAFAPFWIWIISQADWVSVIRHNSLFFLSDEDQVKPKTRPSSPPQTRSSGYGGGGGGDDNTLVVTCIAKDGRTRKCLASTRSCVVAPRSYSFCFIALGGD